MGNVQPKIRQAIRLREIAEELGLSTSLVSKFLNGYMSSSGIPPETANAIGVRARELSG